MSFSYFIEDDTSEYDVTEARSYCSNLSEKIYDASNKVSSLTSSLESLQDKAHDKKGSKIVESFVDFTCLIGDAYEGTGIVGFVNDMNELCNEMSNYISEIEAKTYR